MWAVGIDAGNKLTEQYPDHTGGTSPGQSGYGIVSFTYDPPGRVLRKEDQLGDTVTYNYDLAGRLESRDYRTLANSPSGMIADTDSFTYDDAGRMLTAESDRYSNTVTYTYDDAGRKSTEATTISGVTYTTTTSYDDAGQVSGYTYPDGTAVGRTYTDRGQLATIDYSSTTVDTRSYDDGGRLTGSVYNNGVSESRTYNNDNTLSTISYSGASLGDYSYGWDDNKNKTSESITGTISGYGFDVGSSGYDDEDRLVNWERDDMNLDQSWNLSLVGDWDSFTENSNNQNRTHGPAHELLTAASQTVEHDAKSNQTLIPAVLRPNAQIAATRWRSPGTSTTGCRLPTPTTTAPTTSPTGSTPWGAGPAATTARHRPSTSRTASRRLPTTRREPPPAARRTIMSTRATSTSRSCGSIRAALSFTTTATGSTASPH